MAASQRSVATLRTKTGCLTCRQRHKKCNEARPRCSICTISDRLCVWPAADDLIDGRHTTRRRSRITRESDGLRDVSVHTLFTESQISQEVLGSCLEVVVGRHFIDTYYALLINPDSHPVFYNDWIGDIQAAMSTSTGLRYSVLANAASHLYLAGESMQMQEVALTYYSRSLRGLTQAVARAPFGNTESRNITLTSMIMLYLHGCMGYGTYTDIPMHVSAAIRMIQLRYLQKNGALTFDTAYDRIAVESIVYQIFLVRMGLWSEQPGEGLRFDFDPHFWLACEALLARNVLFPGQSETYNSPVLGMPFALYKLMVMIRKLWETDPQSRSYRRSLQRIEEEVHIWESCLHHANIGDANAPLLATTSATRSESLTEDATALMILSASLLVMHLSAGHGSTVPAPPVDDVWQIPEIVAVLRRRADDLTWAGCYLANYPIYVAGHFMSSEQHIELVRSELRLRSKQMAFSQMHRFWNDLEATWLARKDVAVVEPAI